MQNFNNTALNILATKKANTNKVNIANVLANANNGITFANLAYVTVVKTASAFKHMRIIKVTQLTVQIANSLKAHTNLYVNAVQKSANINNFVSTATYFKHTACYSVVQHKTNNTQYLQFICNANSNAKSVYINTATNAILSKQQVAQYLTNSASKQLLNASTSTYNKANNITHNVVTRTVKLCNIVTLTVAKQTISANFYYAS